MPSEAGELEQLRRKNEQLRAEVAYLGKLRVFRAQQDGEGPRRRLLKAEHRLDVLLRVVGLARSTFFYHQARLGRPDPRAGLKAVITDVFTSNHARYGHRDVHCELVKAGWQVAKKTVLKADAAARAGLPVTPREAMRLVSREIG